MADLLAGTPDPRNDMTRKPSRSAAARAHIQGPLGGAGCRSDMAIVDLRPAQEVPAEQQCQRMGCKTFWPEVKP